jgi:integrase
MQMKGLSYYYVSRGIWTPLGSDLGKAKRKWAELETPGAGLTVGALVLRYLDGVTNAGTLAQYRSYQRAIEQTFPVAATTLRASHLALWRDANTKRPYYINGCLALLSAVWNKGREWGLVEANLAVTKLDVSGRDRVLTDAEYRAIHAQAPAWLRVAMGIAYHAAPSPRDILAMQWSQVSDALYMRRKKTGKRQAFALTAELLSVLATAKERPILGLYIVANDKGRRIGYSTLNDAWRTACEAAGVKDAQFRDLRAKAATDADADGQDATALLGHASAKMTERYIRHRKTVVSQPVKRKILEG